MSGVWSPLFESVLIKSGVDMGKEGIATSTLQVFDYDSSEPSTKSVFEAELHKYQHRGQEAEILVRAIFTCPSYYPAESLRSYKVLDRRSLAKDTVDVVADDDADFDWSDEAEELAALSPTSTELDFEVIFDEATSSTTNEPLEEAFVLSQETEEPSPNVHHISFQGLHVSKKSTTPPEVSGWFVIRQPWLKKIGHGINRRRVTVGQAAKFLDPVYYTGSPDLFDNSFLTGTKLCTALRGLLHKVYLPFGSWMCDKYQGSDIAPTAMAATEPGVWVENSFQRLPVPCTGAECPAEKVINDDGRVHLPQRSDPFRGYYQSRLWIVENAITDPVQMGDHEDVVMEDAGLVSVTVTELEEAVMEDASFFYDHESEKKKNPFVVLDWTAEDIEYLENELEKAFDADEGSALSETVSVSKELQILDEQASDNYIEALARQLGLEFSQGFADEDEVEQSSETYTRRSSLDSQDSVDRLFMDDDTIDEHKSADEHFRHGSLDSENSFDRLFMDIEEHEPSDESERSAKHSKCNSLDSQNSVDRLFMDFDEAEEYESSGEHFRRNSLDSQNSIDRLFMDDDEMEENKPLDGHSRCGSLDSQNSIERLFLDDTVPIPGPDDFPDNDAVNEESSEPAVDHQEQVATSESGSSANDTSSNEGASNDATSHSSFTEGSSIPSLDEDASVSAALDSPQHGASALSQDTPRCDKLTPSDFCGDNEDEEGSLMAPGVIESATDIVSSSTEDKSRAPSIINNTGCDVNEGSEENRDAALSFPASTLEPREVSFDGLALYQKSNEILVRGIAQLAVRTFRRWTWNDGA